MKPVTAFLLILTGVVNSVCAAITQYGDADSFLAALKPGSYSNDFTGAGTGASLSYSGGTGPFAYTISASGGVTGIPMVAASGLGDSLSTFLENDVLIITFTGATKPTAIGGNFFWSDFSSPSNVTNGTVRAQFKIGGATVHTVDVSSTGNTSIGFGGVTTDGAVFDSVTLTLSGYTSGDFFPTIDNFRVGHAKPSRPVIAVQSGPGTLNLQFFGQAGATYTLQRATNLTPPVVWEPLGVFNGTNSLIETTDATTNAPSRFYRLLVE